TLSRAAACAPHRSEQPRLIADKHALEREHALLGLRAPGRREAAELAACGEHAMTRDDQWNGVARHRDADILRGLRYGHAGTPGKLAIGHGFAEGNLALRVVDRAAERIDAVEIDRYGGEV